MQNSVNDGTIDTAGLYQALTAEFSKELVKTRPGGNGKQLSYLPGHVVIRRLNESCLKFGATWDFSILEIRREGPLEICRGSLTIAGLGTREHFGVQDVSKSGGEDVTAKGSATDALKKAASLFGVGQELYDDDTPVQSGGGWADRTQAPRGGYSTSREPAPQRSDRKATEGQKNYLKGLGFKGDLESLSFEEASAHIERLKNGLQDPAEAAGGYDAPVAPPTRPTRPQGPPTRLSDVADELGDMDDPFAE